MSASNQEVELGAGVPALDEFPPHSYEMWYDAAEKLLKGAPFEKLLVTKTYEGFKLQPIYRREDIKDLPHLQTFPGSGNLVRSTKTKGYLEKGWEVSQEAPWPTPETFNQHSLNALQRGQTELNILLDLASQQGKDPDSAPVGEVGACGLSLSCIADLEKAFKDIHLDMVSLYIRAGSSALPMAALLLAYAKKQGIDPAKLKGTIESDPLGTLASLGKLPIALDEAFDEMAEVTRSLSEEAPGLGTIGVQTHAYHDGGCSSSQELGYAMATGLAYIKAMTDRGIDIEVAAPRIRFAFSVGSNYFMEIAKLRAARVLWSQIIKALGGSEEACKMHVHARTAIGNKTKFDPYVNMLRTTTEAFSAVVGGCDSLHVSPFDEIIRLPDEFSSRIARNVQLILMEECDLTRVIDPAGGSYYIEHLTDQLAKKGWEQFQKIEKEGGMIKALTDGKPQADVASIASQRKANIAKRRERIVGTNMYPNASEKPLDERLPDYAEIKDARSKQIADYRISADGETDAAILSDLDSIVMSDKGYKFDKIVEAASFGASIGELCRALRNGQPEGASAEAIPVRRNAEDYEMIRKAAESLRESSPELPCILQLNIGPSRKYRIRADWTSSFFQVGGFELQNDVDFETAEAAIEAANTSKSPIAIITSDDATYAESAVELAQKIKAARPEVYLLLAGAPGDNEAALRDAGIDDFVNVRVNNFEMLQKLLTKIGAIK